MHGRPLRRPHAATRTVLTFLRDTDTSRGSDTLVQRILLITTRVVRGTVIDGRRTGYRVSLGVIHTYVLSFGARFVNWHSNWVRYYRRIANTSRIEEIVTSSTCT